MNIIKNHSLHRLVWIATPFLVLWVLISYWAWYAKNNLGSAAHVTGYALFVVLVLLISLKARKRTLVLPIGTVLDWKRLHLVLGAISLPLYFQHTGVLWPQGVYEQCIAFAFYGVSMSAFLGLWLQKVYPQRLTEVGGEVIFERISLETAVIRQQVNDLILQSAKSHASPALAKFYVESLAWYFQSPRFIWSHLTGSQRSKTWIHQHITILQHYLNEAEQSYLVQLEALAERKGRLDAHYAMQGALKLWLFVHVPMAVLLVLLGTWHLLLINVYTR